MAKAQNLSVNTIIYIALGVIVLILAILAISRYYEGGNETIGACGNLGGSCMGVAGQQCPSGQHNVLGDASCKNDPGGDLCCVNTG